VIATDHVRDADEAIQLPRFEGVEDQAKARAPISVDDRIAAEMKRAEY